MSITTQSTAIAMHVTQYIDMLKAEYITAYSKYMKIASTVRPEILENFSLKSAPSAFFLHTSTINRLKTAINEYDKHFIVIEPPYYDHTRKLTSYRTSTTHYDLSGKYAKMKNMSSKDIPIQLSHAFIEWFNDMIAELNTKRDIFSTIGPDILGYIGDVANNDQKGNLRVVSRVMAKSIKPPRQNFNAMHPLFAQHYVAALNKYKHHNTVKEILEEYDPIIKEYNQPVENNATGDAFSNYLICVNKMISMYLKLLSIPNNEHYLYDLANVYSLLTNKGALNRNLYDKSHLYTAELSKFFFVTLLTKYKNLHDVTNFYDRMFNCSSLAVSHNNHIFLQLNNATVQQNKLLKIYNPSINLSIKYICYYLSASKESLSEKTTVHKYFDSFLAQYNKSTKLKDDEGYSLLFEIPKQDLTMNALTVGKPLFTQTFNTCAKYLLEDRNSVTQYTDYGISLIEPLIMPYPLHNSLTRFYI